MKETDTCFITRGNGRTPLYMYLEVSGRETEGWGHLGAGLCFICDVGDVLA